MRFYIVEYRENGTSSWARTERPFYSIKAAEKAMWKLIDEEGCLGARYSELIPGPALKTLDAVELAANRADPWKERAFLRAQAKAEAEKRYGVVPITPPQ